MGGGSQSALSRATEENLTTSVKVRSINRRTEAGLRAAVHRNRTFSRAGMLERLFTFAFKGLVYPQIWEDPVVDMEALAIKPDDHIVAIASDTPLPHVMVPVVDLDDIDAISDLVLAKAIPLDEAEALRSR